MREQLSPRQAAMNALREWAAIPPPAVARPRLVAAAWRAGERNVNALAEAAGGVSRQTIYNDLTANGIDAKSREEYVMYAPLAKLEDMVADQTLSTQMTWDRVRDEPNAQAATARFERSVKVYHALVSHNRLVPLAIVEEEALLERDRQIAADHAAWNALGAGGDFLGAHHRWVLAHDKAVAAVEAWGEAALACHQAEGWPITDSWTIYCELVPEPQRIPWDRLKDDPAPKVEALLRKLDEEYEHRRRLATETLSALRPAA